MATIAETHIKFHEKIISINDSSLAQAAFLLAANPTELSSPMIATLLIEMAHRLDRIAASEPRDDSSKEES